MNNDSVKSRYKEEKDRVKKEINRIKDIINLNTKLKHHNWAFIHPYLFGYEVDQLQDLADSGNLSSASIFKVFSASFYDFRTTAVFIDGFFKERPSILPFCQLIDQSVILCIQRDYAGAINILLPVIEGSIRHYLVNQQGKQNEKIMKSEDLIKVFYYLKKDYIAMKRDFYSDTYGERVNKGVYFNTNQVEALVKLEAEYIELWFSIIRDYFENNLYLDTRTGLVNDILNRHSIFHGFNADIYYNLENYLKIYHCICFLSWAFGISNKSISALATVEHNDVIYKWKAFEKLNLITNATAQIKSSIYEKYELFNKDEFEQDLKSSIMSRNNSHNTTSDIHKALRIIDQIFDSFIVRK